jgi:histidinol-phosphate/aromatic aminotransferase/cobyric acid decarboxylase-like protein
MFLAVSSYVDVAVDQKGAEFLNLAWTADERDFLSIDLDKVLQRELEDEIRSSYPFFHAYFVRDPWGEGLLLDAIARFFALNGQDFSVTCGAGATSLLQAFAHLPNAKQTYVIGDAYPDFPHWALNSAGAKITTVCESGFGGGIERHIANVVESGSTLVLVDRPALMSPDIPLEEVRRLCNCVSQFGCFVLIDESYANYYPPSFSAVRLVPQCPNLAVLRGLSKAYSLGSLRFGYCVASPQITQSIRSTLPPMLVSSLSLRIARALLNLGDITEGLRQRIAEKRLEATQVLENAEMSLVSQGSPYQPHLVCCDKDALRSLERRGVIAKMHPFWQGGFREVCRLSVPLASLRMKDFREKLQRPEEHRNP